MSRPVTEQDFRRPEFRDAKVEDYEFRRDGALVRKDRWEQGIHRIHSIVGRRGRDFEISEVVEAVEQLKGQWLSASHDNDPESEWIDVRLRCGSVLAGCVRTGAFAYRWPFGQFNFTRKDFGSDIVAFQPIPDPKPSPEAHP
ncbi:MULTISPECIES: hypothetical protein [unclassified Pseudomonas]|uniref:hypothetical protein n=1 Tax=unclassified Pseudomonas TaxID=196821 RepID=UPI001AE52E8F|nr:MULTISPECIES: hypothetical protein [unclassified Pseudomonas]HDS1695789.1 hypothetical protein [Pseudomonas putida]MBP2270783.1 hypothetical protein [Pseudomonas sp. BP6]MBP2284934.1 hypothetical protein [Pseudomonas sp. BP7]MBP2290251.1 hypothetical protein [Pseudomonas sp. BP7]HDS1701011.1 hypothetical protein [Pseudomonas putida]